MGARPVPGVRPRLTARRRRGPASLAGQVLALQLALLVTIAAAGWALAVDQARDTARGEAIARARSTVVTLSYDPTVLAAVTGPDPAGALAGPIEQLRRANDISFLVVMSPNGTRYTHPDPDEIGRTFQGTITGAQGGATTVEDYTGTLGPSVRVVTPIRDETGRIVALASAGVPLASIGATVRQRAAQLGALALAAAAVASAGAAVFARRLHRQTHGLGPAELARLYEYHEALLHSVRAGLVMIDRDGTVVLCNDEARTLLDVPSVAAGSRVADLGLEPGLGELMASGRGCEGEMFATARRTLVVTQVAAIRADTRLGWVTTLADRTDLLRVNGELDSLRRFTESLRARAHEDDNRLHTVVALIELGHYEQAVSFATSHLADAQELVDQVTAAVHEPPLTALLLGESARAAERGVRLEIDTETSLPLTGLDPRDLVVIWGNLIDNAVDAAAATPPPHWVRTGAVLDGDNLVIRVADSGPGVPPDSVPHIFTRGWSTKGADPEEDRPQGRGLGLSLVRATAHRLGGTVEVRNEGGATFVVRLPRPPAVPEDRASAGRASAS